MDDVELLILLSPSFECLDYRSEPLALAYETLEIELRALCILGKHSTNWATSPAPLAFLKLEKNQVTCYQTRTTDSENVNCVLLAASGKCQGSWTTLGPSKAYSTPFKLWRILNTFGSFRNSL